MPLLFNYFSLETVFDNVKGMPVKQIDSWRGVWSKTGQNRKLTN